MKQSKQVAIVTGATSGIGEAIARLLANNGVNVVINSVRSVEKGQLLANELTGAVYCQGDISQQADCQNIINLALEQFGQLDILVNNANKSVRQEAETIEAVSSDVLRQTLDGNVIATWQMIQTAIPYLRDSGNGNIINITASSGINPASSMSGMPLAVAKAALNHLTKLLAVSCGPHIRANAIAPGLIETPRTQHLEETIQYFCDRSPLKTVGQPNDIAELALAIIKSKYINGEVIMADGGFVHV